MESWRCAFCGLTLQAVTKAAAAAGCYDVNRTIECHHQQYADEAA